MGWASGSYFAEQLYYEIKQFVPEEKRIDVGKRIYKFFCNEDADDWSYEFLEEIGENGEES